MLKSFSRDMVKSSTRVILIAVLLLLAVVVVVMLIQNPSILIGSAIAKPLLNLSDSWLPFSLFIGSLLLLLLVIVLYRHFHHKNTLPSFSQPDIVMESLETPRTPPANPRLEKKDVPISPAPDKLTKQLNMIEQKLAALDSGYTPTAPIPNIIRHLPDHDISRHTIAKQKAVKNPVAQGTTYKTLAQDPSLFDAEAVMPKSAAKKPITPVVKSVPIKPLPRPIAAKTSKAVVQRPQPQKALLKAPIKPTELQKFVSKVPVPKVPFPAPMKTSTPTKAVATIPTAKTAVTKSTPKPTLPATRAQKHQEIQSLTDEINQMRKKLR